MGVILRIRIDLKIMLVMFGVLAVVPIFTHSNLYIMNILIMCLVWGVVAAAWDLIMGLAGIFTFAQIAFFAVGGYTSAMICGTTGLTPWLGMLIGGLVAAIFGVLVGIPCLNLKGSYVALVTFAFHMLLEPFIKSDLGKSIGTGGPQGLISIPAFKIGNYTFSSMEPIAPYFVAFFLALIFLLIIYWIIHSPLGLAFVSLRDSELFGKSIGIDDFKYKLLVFAISAFITGVMGGFYAHYVGMMSSRTLLGLELFIFLMLMLVAGGMGRFPGALLGAFIVTIVGEFLRPLETYRMLIFGGLIMLFIAKMPQGILGVVFDRMVKSKGYESQY
jgi:branched-chain amino acid transport system permease protein